MAVQLLSAGYTPAETSSRLKLHPGAVYDLSKEESVRKAIAAGVERRREALGHGLQAAANDAMTVLSVLMNDPAVPPKERIRAAETLLDRSGLTPDAKAQPQVAAAVSVDVDFDNRLARIVAAGGSQNLGD
jgi:3-oxoacyl-(acyl-carrier-protein) synthase